MLVAAAALVGGVAFAASASAAQVDVKMLNAGPGGMPTFSPSIVRIAPGDTVQFLNTDKGHNVESIPGMIPAGAPAFKGALSQSLAVKFAKPGVYAYRCSPHSALGMVGLVVVGKPVNEAALKAQPQMGMAKASFAKLFTQLDSGH